jgi:hypothetical protein
LDDMVAAGATRMVEELRRRERVCLNGATVVDGRLLVMPGSFGDTGDRVDEIRQSWGVAAWRRRNLWYAKVISKFLSACG